MNNINNFDALIVTILSALIVVLIALSIRAKTKRKHVNQRDELTFEKVVLAVGETEKEQQKFFDDGHNTIHTKSTNEKRTEGKKYTQGVSTKDQGFQFFKKTNRDGAGSKANGNIEDDVYLLGIEQEMLATRQLYLDGLISKEVYIAETRSSLKSTNRMT